MNHWIINLLVAGGLVMGSQSSVAASDLKVLRGHVPRAVFNLTPTGRLAPTNRLRLAIGLPMRDPAGLDNFLQRVYDPASPSYHQFLTVAELTTRFGPTEQDYEAVKNFALANGLAITTTHPNRLLLDVAGPASAVEQAFHVTLRTYRHPTEGRQFFAPDTEPEVDVALPVADVQGLSDYSRPHPLCRQRGSSPAAPRNGSAPDGSGAFFGNDFRNAYAPGVTLTGEGQTVGVLEFDGYYPSDISAYAAEAGNGRANIVVQAVLLDGYNGTPGDGNAEVSLDIEMAMSMAPGLSEIVSFEAGPDGSPNDVLNSMLTYSNSIKQLSCSWGWSGGPNSTIDNIFKSMEAVGQSFFNAAGDSDAFTSGSSSVNGVDNPSLDDTPASSPYITQVGGTTLTMNGTGASYNSETVWNWGYDNGSYVGTCGGISSYYTFPSWQAGFATSANGGSTSFRNIPDVALTADQIYVAYGDGSSGEFGGTSCATPLWAGFTALMNQQTALNGRSPVGFINPAIYTLAAGPGYANCFHDITTGNNTWPDSPSLFYATTGYDLCSGLGTPTGQSLINALTAPPDSLVVTPATGFTATGLPGGPFTGGSLTLTLSNSSSSALSWTLINTSSWLTLSPASGLLSGAKATNVTADLNATANTLSAGNYSASVWFSNQTTGIAQLRQFTLEAEPPQLVQNGGFETGSFADWTLNGSTRYNVVSSDANYVHSGGYGAMLGQPNSLGYLSQTLATAPGQMYLLSLWLDNPVNSYGATPNQFLVEWNGTTLFNQGNIPNISWTNLEFFVTASGTSTVLEFGFYDSPYYLGLDDISVTPLSSPAFRRLQATSGALNITWNAVAGLVYQVQYETNLAQSAWIDLGKPIVATNDTLTLSDTNTANSPTRFYRLVVSP
ncbi:MAG: protease pro-enzyme activation domain-containing protein [Limisphaerales bacterium]